MNECPPATDSAWRAFGRRLGDAWQGVRTLVRTQANARIHAAFTILVVIAGFAFGIGRLEWCAIISAIALVWTAEGINTAIEAVVDLASPEIHPLAGKAKDVAAGAVLLAALASVVIGVLVFGPRLLALLGR